MTRTACRFFQPSLPSFLRRRLALPQQSSQRYKNRPLKAARSTAGRPATQQCFPTFVGPSTSSGVCPQRLYLKNRQHRFWYTCKRTVARVHPLGLRRLAKQRTRRLLQVGRTEWPDALSPKAVDSVTEHADETVFAHSSTSSVPFIPLWPMPQTLEQRKWKVPALSAVNSTTTVVPLGIF